MATHAQILPGMADADYRARPELSHSDLKSFVSGKPMARSRRLIVGTALHTLVLEGFDSYIGQFHECFTEHKLNTKEGKESFALEGVDGKTSLRPSEWRLVRGMADSLNSHPQAAKVIGADGENELCVLATPEGFSTPCKCLIDMKRRACLVDLKTTGYLTHDEFRQAIVDYGYASQAAFYVDMYAAATGEYLQWFFVCVSKTSLDVWVEPITHEQLAFGRRWYKDILALYERGNCHD